jgi:hypothetical protein
VAGSLSGSSEHSRSSNKLLALSLKAAQYYVECELGCRNRNKGGDYCQIAGLPTPCVRGVAARIELANPWGVGHWQWLDMDNPTKTVWWRACCHPRVRRQMSSRMRSASAWRHWNAGGRRRWPPRPVSSLARAANAGRQRRGWRR